MQQLLERNDVGVNTYEPLSKEADKGYEAVIRLLLERNDVGVNTGADILGPRHNS